MLAKKINSEDRPVHDYLNRLTSIASVPSADATVSYAYQYNDANQRTRVTMADGSYWLYHYDKLGQVTSGKKYWSDNTPVAGQQFGYAFDDIGNRTSTQAGGDEKGTNLRASTYTPNLLNQYTSRTVPNKVDILGSSTNTSTVSANNIRAIRKSDYYRAELSLDNSSGPVLLNVTNTAVLNNGPGGLDVVTNSIGTLFVPQATEAFTHDDDGNLTLDGRWTYAWDAENRLISMTANSSVPSIAKLKLQFGYDYRGRRITKKVSNWNGSDYALQNTTKFLYDEWNLLVEAGEANTRSRSYLWGADLAGSLHTAGGIGGLLSVSNAASTACFLTCDGNGNTSQLVEANSGNSTASYEYGPFGEVIKISGALYSVNPFLYSTKYRDDETGLAYYGYRYYDAGRGGWLSRDPIDEEGGVNLYGFIANEPISGRDFLGLKGSGHHIMPWSIFNGAVKSEVQRFFDSDLARIFNEHYKSHGAEKLDGISAKEYNKLVSKELDEFLGKKALKQMTLEQAEQFLARIKGLPATHPITIYNEAVRREAASAMKKALGNAGKQAAEGSLKKVLAAGAKKGGTKLAKGIPLVGAVVAVYFYAEDAEAYGYGSAAVNTGIDAIPLVGTGKIIAEAYHGYRFLDVIIGPKKVQPSESDCVK